MQTRSRPPTASANERATRATSRAAVRRIHCRATGPRSKAGLAARLRPPTRGLVARRIPPADAPCASRRRASSTARSDCRRDDHDGSREHDDGHAGVARTRVVGRHHRTHTPAVRRVRDPARDRCRIGIPPLRRPGHDREPRPRRRPPLVAARALLALRVVPPGSRALLPPGGAVPAHRKLIRGASPSPRSASTPARSWASRSSRDGAAGCRSC